ncbi:MAG: glycine cleavage system protein GcvH [Planctomycetota bacterium]|nr:MAG: glycine cleavage system protein GcvH [Planctomycetota bacterium]
MRPDNYRYTESHEWVCVEGDTALVGITDFAVQELTDLIFVDLPAPGTKVKKGEPFGEIESVKTVAELYAPVSGEIIEVHSELAENIEILSESPFEKGWMIKIKLDDPSEIEALLTKEAYDELVANH